MAYSSNSPGMHLQDLILDTKVTATSAQKIECLSLLKVVVKNLADPAKCDNPKYRQLRLSNEKVEKKLLPCPSALSYLEAVGFTHVTDDDGSRFLRVVVEKVDTHAMGKSLLELTNALHMLDPQPVTKKKKPSLSFSEEKKTSEGVVVSSISTDSGPQTEKQKARVLLERKRKAEAEEAKAARAKNIAMLKADKHTRMHDPNWKSGVSAACMKSGDSISTFRDKFGEGE